jgi:cation transport ATPase
MKNNKLAAEERGVLIKRHRVEWDGRVFRARHLSRAIMRNIRQNLFFTFIYNALSIPLPQGYYPSFSVFSLA